MEPITKTFEMRHGVLVRHVVPRRGRPYEQRCDLGAFTEVSHLIDGREPGLTTNEMWDALPNLPSTRLSVALDFLKERGVVRVEGRRCYPASRVAFEDGLVEWHALDHESRSES